MNIPFKATDNNCKKKIDEDEYAEFVVKEIVMPCGVPDRLGEEAEEGEERRTDSSSAGESGKCLKPTAGSLNARPFFDPRSSFGWQEHLFAIALRLAVTRSRSSRSRCDGDWNNKGSQIRRGLGGLLSGRPIVP